MTKYTSAFNITLENGQRTTIALSPFELKVLKVVANGRGSTLNNYILRAIKNGVLDGMFNRSRAVLDQLISDLFRGGIYD